MSKIKLEAPFTAFRGKICKHSKIIYAQRGDTQYTSQLCHPRTKPFSAEELARQTMFGAAMAAVKALTSEEKAAYATAFAGQSKYKTLHGYMVAQEYAKLA